MIKIFGDKYCGYYITFGKEGNTLRSRKAGMQIKRKVLSECVIPVTTDGSET